MNSSPHIAEHNSTTTSSSDGKSSPRKPTAGRAGHPGVKPGERVHSAERRGLGEDLLPTVCNGASPVGPSGQPKSAFDATEKDPAVASRADDVANVAKPVSSAEPVEAERTASGKADLYADAIKRIRTMPEAEVEQAWLPLALRLPEEHVRNFIKEVSHLTGVGVRTLNARLKAERSHADARVASAHVRDHLGARRMVRYEPENRVKHAEELEAAMMATASPGSFIQFGSALCQVTYKQMPYGQPIGLAEAEAPLVPQIVPLDEVALLERAERVMVFTRPTKDSGVFVRIAIPDAIINILLKKAVHQAPVVTGLLTHPIVLPGSGEILSEDGLHRPTGLFLAGAAVDGVQAYSQAEATEAVHRLRRAFLEGFEFVEPLDADAALAALITGVLRRVLDIAPGLAILASTQASGKTTLARRLHLVLTGQDMPVHAFPQGDEAEMQKRLLAVLLRSPAMVCFDNLLDGTTFRSAALAAAMTGPVLSQRVLGLSRDADCPTNVLFVITGNNLMLGADEVSRWLVVRLASGQARPEQRQFKHADVVGHALGIRSEVLRDVVGIVAGYIRSGVAGPTRTRFHLWDQMVRQPLMWAGAEDVADVFESNESNSEDSLAQRALLSSLVELFGLKEFFASDVARYAAEGRLSAEAYGSMEPSADELQQQLVSALHGLRAKDAKSENSVGRVLQAKVNRPIVIGDERTRTVVLRSRAVNGRKKYRVEGML